MMMKSIAGLLAAMFFLAQVSLAKNYAYVYIEGDKQTPFYVKLEGQMLPRQGKNYCIIANLDAGITNIEILFQQNKYPAQKFVIKVPPEGSRGFILQKVNDRQFALYDMQQGIYLVSGNKAEDDQVPAAGQVTDVPVAIVVPQAQGGVTDQNTDIPAFAEEKKPRKKKVTKQDTQEEPVAREVKEDGRFLSDIELNADGSQKETPASVPAFKPEKTTAKNNKRSKKVQQDETGLPAMSNEDLTEEKKQPTVPVETPEGSNSMPNTDCKTPMSSDDFENFALKILDKADDDARLKVLSKNKGRLCFTTEQVRIIANNLETQSGRYEVVRILYPQTSDQDNFGQLESLFKTNYLKNKFKEIIKH